MRVFLFSLILLGLLPPAVAAPPNFLVVLADDLGYSDLGSYGGEIVTPNLDRLASGGVRFSQFYSTARCWPSRAALLTGYYAQQVRRDVFAGGKLGHRPDWAPLLSARLKAAGYRNYHAGKWHVDGNPMEQGFDRSYLLEDQNRFFTTKSHFLDGAALPEPAEGFYATVAIADRAVEFLKEHAAHHGDAPFFHYLAFTAPHFPLQALPEDIERYRERYRAGWDALRVERWGRLRAMGMADHPLPPLDPEIVPAHNLSPEEQAARIGPGEVARAVLWDSLTEAQKEFQATKMAIHAAMVDRMDRELGRVLDQLKSMNAFDNTVILFLSDNGASAEQIIRGDGHDPGAAPGSAGSHLGLGAGFSSLANTPFRLHKIWTHEGGIASPFIVHWPAGLKAHGAIRQQPGHVIDIAPTLLALAGIEAKIPEGAPPLSGTSLAPAILEDGPIARPYLWWHHEGRSALRQENWKIVRLTDDSPWALYDLASDRGEINDLAGQHPERVGTMADTWKDTADQFRSQAR